MRSLLAMISFLTLPFLAVAADIPAPTGDTIVPQGARLRVLFTRSAPLSGGLTEGPAVAPDGTIYFSDIPMGKDKGMILRFDPKTQKTSVFTDDSHKSNGMKFDAKGYLIVCEGADGGGRQLARYDVKTGKRTTLIDRYKDKRFNSPNDLAIDLKGRIYFTDPRYVGDEPRELNRQAVYRLDTDGTLIEVTHDCEKPNGLVLSPDQKTFYLVDHNNGSDKIDSAPSKKGAMKVYAFDLDDEGLIKKGSKRTLYDWGTEDGSDGMTVDVKGNVYMISRSVKRPGVIVTDPTGKELAYIPTAAPQPGVKEAVGIPSNCAFGLGNDSNTLYVTMDKSLYRIKLKIDGFHIPFEGN